MKWLLILTAFFSIQAIAQNTGRLENQKDAWGTIYTYVGEMKNGKPNGMGIARYGNGNVIRYAGNFVNGVFSGKGTLLFSNGAFLSGNWSNGKLNGKGAHYTSTGDLYIGDFANGLRQGKGILINKDNSVVKGDFSNDKINGRCVEIWAHGKTINDNIYEDNKRTGTGFQYEASTKKLFEGEWKDDKWVQAGNATYASFLKNVDFTSEINDDHVLMGPVDTKGFLRDTSYFYDLKAHRRYFGFYDHGHLKDGISIRDDSTRFVGKLNDDGAIGYSYYLKLGRSYSEGNYAKDYLNGQVLSVDLIKKTVYYGDAVDGIFTGKAYFFNNSDEMYAGDYKEGKFTGQGYTMNKDGKTVSGTWLDGSAQKVTAITTADGKIIPGSPKTFNEALNIVAKDYPNNFDNISGYVDYLFSPTDYIADAEDADGYDSFISFPSTADKDKIIIDFETNNAYMATYISTTDPKKAKAKYDEMAKQLLSASISNNLIQKSIKLKGTIEPTDNSGKEVSSKFDLPGATPEYDDFHVWLQLKKDSDGNYLVLVIIGKMEE